VRNEPHRSRFQVGAVRYIHHILQSQFLVTKKPDGFGNHPAFSHPTPMLCGVVAGGIVALGKNALDHIRGAFDDSQQGQRRPSRFPTFLLPFLDGAFGDVQQPGELALRNPELEAQGRRVGNMDGLQFLVLAAFDAA